MTHRHMANVLIRLFCVLLAAGALVGVAPKAGANPVPWGDPALGHSWDQLWMEMSDQAFNRVIAQIAAPPNANFEAPGFLSFSDSSWFLQSSTAGLIVATGAATDHLEFTTHFTGAPSDYTALNPFIIDMWFLNGANVVDAHRWIWDGNLWVDPDPSDPPSVPDGGATVLLLGFGVLGMAAFVGKRGAKRRS